MSKKLFTKEQFQKMLKKEAERMANDKALNRKGVDLLIDAAEYHWIHQTEWLGEPVLNPAQDMFARQEIIFKTKPDYIIELGVAWGGSLLFYSTLMEIIGGKKIIGIDIFMPPDLIKRLKANKRLSKRLVFINGPSTEKDTLNKVKKIIGKNKKLLVILDSNHTHEHVLNELRAYSPLIGKGYYLICDDTFVEDIGNRKSKINENRPWGPGNNPETARRQFLKENKKFAVDEVIKNKILISCNANGYLKRIKS